MKYFLDTEFIEKPNTIDLISIGIKCEDGREYYAISSQYEFTHANEWVIDNVIVPMYEETVPNTTEARAYIGISDFHQKYGKEIRLIKQEILEFVNFPVYKDGKPEFWAYYGAYDHVVMCWIFGRMIDLPEGFPMITYDLKQLADSKPHKKKFPSPGEGEHNALVDAIWNKAFYEYLMDNEDRLCPIKT